MNLPIISYENLLSGALGAIIAVAITIAYQEWKSSREHSQIIAKERLEKVYGPLMLMYNVGVKITGKNDNFYYSDEEGGRVDDIILHNYHLIEPGRREKLEYMYHLLRYKGDAPTKEILTAIKEGYEENVKKSGIE